jgi:hypothetical protein
VTCTARDSSLMETLGRYGVLSTEQVAEKFFPNVALTTVRRRLRHLEREERIYRVRGLDNGGVAWALTKHAAQRLGCVYPARHFCRNSIPHDVALSRVRLALERVGLGERWVPEHQLKAQASLNGAQRSEERPFVPDALFTVRQKAEVRVIALELELHGKSRKRYEAILNRYRRKKTLWGVWYLVPTESLGQTLEKVWRDLNGGRRNDLLMWSILDSLLQDPLNVAVRSEHFNYPLKQLVNPEPRSEQPALPGALPESRPKAAPREKHVEAVF